jgi:hypothetical protein
MDHVGSTETDEDECIVCFEAFGDRKNMILWPCSHFLCEECTRKIFGIQETAGCPQCRRATDFTALTCVTPTVEMALERLSRSNTPQRQAVSSSEPTHEPSAPPAVLVVGAHNGQPMHRELTPPPPHDHVV